MSSSDAGRELVRRRWDRPDVVEDRVNRLGDVIQERLDRLPPLTEEQKLRLTRIINGGR